MPSTSFIVAAVAAVPVLAVAANAVSELAQEPEATALSQPWELGEATSLSLALDGRGNSSLAWSGDRPLGIESRHELGEGVSLHFGAEALAGALPIEASGGVPDWQAGAAVRAKIDDHWSAGVGAGWRSTSTATGLSAAIDSDRRVGALDDGEGVVWFRLSASF